MITGLIGLSYGMPEQNKTITMEAVFEKIVINKDSEWEKWFKDNRPETTIFKIGNITVVNPNGLFNENRKNPKNRK